MIGRRRGTVDIGALGGVAALAAVCAVAGFWGASALARPADVKARLAELEAQTVRVEHAARARGGADRWPEGAVCPRPAVGAVALQARLSNAAAAAGVKLGAVSVSTPAPPGEGDGPLTRVPFRLQAAGDYRAVLLMLDVLDKAQPTVFVDTADLKPGPGDVKLDLSGEVLCWTYARR
jgi:hypothetical protein